MARWGLCGPTMEKHGLYSSSPLRANASPPSNSAPTPSVWPNSTGCPSTNDRLTIAPLVRGRGGVSCPRTFSWCKNKNQGPDLHLNRGHSGGYPRKSSRVFEGNQASIFLLTYPFVTFRKGLRLISCST